MKRTIVGLVLLAGTACAAPAPSGDWDPQAATSLKSEVEWMFKALDAGDIQGMLGRMDTSSAVVFDLDDKNQPVRAAGFEAVKKYMNGLGAAMKSQGMKATSTIKTNDCHATKVMGYCAIEFEQSMAMGGQTMGPFKFQGTLVARKVGEAWRWVHWHGSMAEMPKMEAADSGRGKADDKTTAKTEDKKKGSAKKG
jgi:hypothetical protein